MDETPTEQTAPTRIESTGPLLLAGLARRYRGAENAEIPGQWQAFGPRLGSIPGALGAEAYGVVYNVDDENNHEYLCAVAVGSFDPLPADLDRLRLPARRYAVFQHAGHVSDIRRTCHSAFSQWIPEAGLSAADAPFFEKYGADFDPDTGTGGLEIWIPID